MNIKLTYLNKFKLGEYLMNIGSNNESKVEKKLFYHFINFYIIMNLIP